MDPMAEAIAAFERGKARAQVNREDAERAYGTLDQLRAQARAMGYAPADDFKERRTVFREIGVTLREVDRKVRVARQRHDKAMA